MVVGELIKTAILPQFITAAVSGIEYYQFVRQKEGGNDRGTHGTGLLLKAVS